MAPQVGFEPSTFFFAETVLAEALTFLGMNKSIAYTKNPAGAGFSDFKIS
jgi:hypothetical protein